MIFFTKNIFGVPHLRIFDPWKYQKMICFHKNLHVEIFCDVFDEKKIIFWYFYGSKILKWSTPKIFLGPKIFWPPQSWIFWARILWIEIEVQFWFLMKNIILLVLLRVKNPKIEYPKIFLGPKIFWPPQSLNFWAGRPCIEIEVWFLFFPFSEKFYNFILFQKYP